MNAFFDGYVHFGTTFKKFMGQYENALQKKVQNEEEEDMFFWVNKTHARCFKVQVMNVSP